jgi:CheY-like chemotaxis protein
VTRASAPACGERAAPHSAAPPAERCRVLVVDDNVDSAQSLSLLLGLEGYRVECAYDGEDGLCVAARFRPQVVLMDLGLPGVSGYEVARRLRGAGGAAADPAVLLVAVSGYGRDCDRREAREAGFDLHLTKPADPDAVLRVLAEWRMARAAEPIDAGGRPRAEPNGPAAGGRPRAEPNGPAAGA